ncbi:hypothetical protein ACF09J_34940 [Streptomyces sp. NPDC014889]|uniref:hypothetical protein n=1 Tax=Streptomyces sp. NPDC014889 TaxID=3364928 RepID=UPI0036F67113
MKMMQSSGPFVMVRQGRREDRAMVYDRFVQACARCLRAGGGEGVEDVWAAWQAIDLRCRPAVRVAADRLAGYTLTISDPDDSGSFYRVIMEVQFPAAYLPWGNDPELGPRDYPTVGGTMLFYLSAFTKVARADLNRRWWNAPAWAWRDVKAWREKRRQKRESARETAERLRAYEAAVAKAVAEGEGEGGGTHRARRPTPGWLRVRGRGRVLEAGFFRCAHSTPSVVTPKSRAVRSSWP